MHIAAVRGGCVQVCVASRFGDVPDATAAVVPAGARTARSAHPGGVVQRLDGVQGRIRGWESIANALLVVRSECREQDVGSVRIPAVDDNETRERIVGEETQPGKLLAGQREIHHLDARLAVADDGASLAWFRVPALRNPVWNFDGPALSRCTQHYQH